MLRRRTSRGTEEHLSVVPCIRSEEKVPNGGFFVLEVLKLDEASWRCSTRAVCKQASRRGRKSP